MPGRSARACGAVTRRQGAGSQVVEIWDGSYWERNCWRSETEMLDATAERLGKLIDRDRELLEASSRRLRRSLWVALAAILLGVSALVVGRLA